MRCRGFTLIEVVVAVAIAGLLGGMLTTIHVASVNRIERARDMTVGSLLARSKMIDIEQAVFDKGFVEGQQTEDGDFADEGYRDITWRYTVSEVEMDAEAFGLAEAQPFLDRIAQNARAVDLTVTWPDGSYQGSLRVRALLTSANHALGVSEELNRALDALGSGAIPDEMLAEPEAVLKR